MVGVRVIDHGKKDILGVKVDVVDYEGAVARILAAAISKEPLGVSALAVHGVLTGALDPEHKYRLNKLGLITPDGQPVRWALRLLYGQKLPDRVYGPNLTLRVCEQAADLGLSIYLYGSRQSILDAWTTKLREQLPNLRIAGSEPSKFRQVSETESREIDARIVASGADIVMVGLGCPRQEVFVYEHVEHVSRPMLAVGAAFDFHAGMLRQAPRWMQDCGLEWLFRLWMEPRRLWRRYLYLNPLYCLMLVIQLLGVGKRLRGEQRMPRGLGYA